MTEVDCRHTVGVGSLTRVEVDHVGVQLGKCVACQQVVARRYVVTGPGTGPWTVLPRRLPVSEAVFEKMADMRVMRRLMRDPRYRNAENAEEASAAEEAITDEVVAELEREYVVQ